MRIILLAIPVVEIFSVSLEAETVTFTSSISLTPECSLNLAKSLKCINATER